MNGIAQQIRIVTRAADHISLAMTDLHTAATGEEPLAEAIEELDIARSALTYWIESVRLEEIHADVGRGGDPVGN